jgi:hypothetical protein
VRAPVIARTTARHARVGTTHVRYGGDLTDTQEAAEESTTGPHQRVDNGTAELMGIDGGARVARRGVDTGVGRHGGSAATYRDDGGEG